MSEHNFPFGMNPSEQEIEKAVASVREEYKNVPETVCCHKAECCNAGCPNMYWGEFLSIRRGVVDKMTSQQRIDVTVKCLQRYLYDQSKPKPCLFLGADNKCTIYDYRHLKCRLYGLIPDSLYSLNANTVAKEMGVPREEVPLCSQCKFVKVKPEFKDKFPNNKVPQSSIKKMEKSMRELDRGLGLEKEIQDEGFGFLTYHDWHLLFEFGEKWMESLTKIRLHCTDEEKEKFVSALKSELAKGLAPTDSEPKGPENE